MFVEEMYKVFQFGGYEIFVVTVVVVFYEINIIRYKYV